MLFKSSYPLSAFYFKVVIALSGSSMDTSFQDVSGISLEIGVEEVEEGGENRFLHRLPKAVKHGNLVLKRGIAPSDSPLATWCMDTLEADMSSTITTSQVWVYLLDENQIPIRGWFFDNAYPVKWEIDAFNSTKNEVAIETIELAYYTVNRII